MEYNVLPDNVYDLEGLELWHNQFMNMTYYQRKMSNDMSIQQYGEDNITRYNKRKSKLLDFETSNNEEIPYLSEDTDLFQYEHDLDHAQDRYVKVKTAEADGLILMYDLRDFEEEFRILPFPELLHVYQKKWEAFNALPSNKRSLSNQTAESIFGVDNYNLYNVISNRYMMMIENLGKREIHLNPYSKMGTYYTPSEMKGIPTDKTLINTESGEIKDKYTWASKLDKLSSLLENCADNGRRSIIKEQIKSLWWNPEIPFSIESASKTYLRKK